MNALSTYLAARRRTIESSIAAEKLAGNEFKLACERAALAEITALECQQWGDNPKRIENIESSNHSPDAGKMVPMSPQTDEPLKTCPFCGKIPTVNDRTGDVACQTLYCVSEASWGTRERWNTRACDESAHALIEEIAVALRKECGKFNFPDEDRPIIWAALQRAEQFLNGKAE